MKRQQAKKNKWKKRLGITVLIFIVLIGAAVFYWMDQFKQGQQLAGDSTITDSADSDTIFDGPEPVLGEMNILLLGSDARKEEDGRSDSLMVANFTQDTGEVKLISIMRDTYVNIPGHGQHKMNAAFSIGGPELVRQTIKENFDVDIHYYAMVDFKGFPKLVDLVAPDGIEIDVEHEMSHGIYMTIPAGKQILHGEQLLGYVRYRHDSKNDFGRVARQQEVLSKLKEEAASIHSILKLPKLLGAAEGYIDTNLESKTMLAIGKAMLDHKSQSVQSLRIPVDNSYTDADTASGEVLAIDFDKNKEAWKSFIDGSLQSEKEENHSAE